MEFKTAILISSVCDYSDTHILVKGTITVPNTGTVAVPSNGDKEAIFKSSIYWLHKQNKQ